MKKRTDTIGALVGIVLFNVIFFAVIAIVFNVYKALAGF